MKSLICFLLLSVGALAQVPVVQSAPVWVPLCHSECYTITAPAGTTLRYGAAANTYASNVGSAHSAGDPSPETWVVKTLTADTTFTGVDDFFGGDPLPGVNKEVDVLETAQPQTVVNLPNWGAGSVAIPVTVPALPPVAPPSSPVNQPGATISTGDWQGDGLPCHRMKVTAKNPDGTSGKDYWLEICGPIN